MNSTDWNKLMHGASAFTTECRTRLKPEHQDALDNCLLHGGRVEVRLSLGLSELRARLVAIEANGSEWEASGDLVMQMTQTQMDA